MMMNRELIPFLQQMEQKWARLGKGATIEETRAHYEVIAREMRLPTPEGISTDTIQWIDTPAGQVRTRIFRHDSGGIQPCLIYMHGGSWLQGSPETHWDITSRIAAQNRQTVISVDYAKAPEHPFPAALNQCVAVVKWVFENSKRLAIDPERIAIGGDSAGGNLAAATALSTLPTEPQLLAQLLIYPATDFDTTWPSVTENADGPVITAADLPVVTALYCPNEEDRLNPFAAPLKATSHAGLPPTYIAVAECDPLRDSGIAYALALREAGVTVELDQGAGLIHGYLRALDYCSSSVEKLNAMIAWLDHQNKKQRGSLS